MMKFEFVLKNENEKEKRTWFLVEKIEETEQSN